MPQSSTIAVVGADVAELATAHNLKRKYRVTLFGKNDKAGVQAHRVAIPDDPDKGTPVDTWENGYSESFCGTLREELMDREICTTLVETQALVARWRREYNAIRSHSSLGHRPPVPETVEPRTPA